MELKIVIAVIMIQSVKVRLVSALLKKEMVYASLSVLKICKIVYVGLKNYDAVQPNTVLGIMILQLNVGNALILMVAKIHLLEQHAGWLKIFAHNVILMLNQLVA